MAKIILTNHAKDRIAERNIDSKEIKEVIERGVITKTYSDGRILKEAICESGRHLSLVLNFERKIAIIITAYYEN